MHVYVCISSITVPMVLGAKHPGGGLWGPDFIYLFHGTAVSYAHGWHGWFFSLVAWGSLSLLQAAENVHDRLHCCLSGAYMNTASH